MTNPYRRPAPATTPFESAHPVDIVLSRDIERRVVTLTCPTCGTSGHLDQTRTTPLVRFTDADQPTRHKAWFRDDTPPCLTHWQETP